MRAQLRLALVRRWSLLAVLVGGLPLLFACCPSVADAATCSASRCRGCCSAFAVYPVLVALGWPTSAPAERNERDFADVVGAAVSDRRAASASSRCSWSRCRRSAIGTWGLRFSRTTATSTSPRARSGPRCNASAIGGEYLSAASFLGIAGLVLAYGADMLWYPVGWTAGYLVLLVLVAAPLRRSGAYTLPDFAEARLESRPVRTSPRRWSWRSAGST